MSKSNSCFLIGNLGADPIERARGENGPIVGFTVAENVQTFDKGTRQYKTIHTNWFQVTVFGSLAERVRSGLHKGDRVAIQGRMKVSRYTDRAGIEKTSFEIIADEVGNWQTLPSASAGANGNKVFAAAEYDPSSAINEESLPF